MSDTVEFNGIPVGDEARLLLPEAEALASAAEPMLWSSFADLPVSSRGWVYRIRAAVVIASNSDWALMQRIGSLRAALGADKADLVWKTGSVVRIIWPDARLDAIRPATPDERRRIGLDAAIILEFTTASDPLAP